MDAQIDLTENRDFGKNILNIDRIKNRAIYGKYLWSWNKALYCNDPKDELIYTGNAEERFYKTLPGWGTPGYCDCCGSLVAKYPWQITIDYTLCEKCDSNKNTLIKGTKWLLPWNI